MLRSTHRPSQQDPKGAHKQQLPPLPAGWTEHKAPTGHSYYYNAATTQSTYTRPVDQQPQEQQQTYLPNQNLYLQAHALQHQAAPTNLPQIRMHHDHQHRPRSRPQNDRPKSAHPIPDCSPWLLVKTRLGRRFVHNSETKESFWRFPKEIIGGVVEYDIQERKRREVLESTQVDGAKENRDGSAANEPAAKDERTAPKGPEIVPAAASEHGDEMNLDAESDEYEEVEVTDSEFEDDADADSSKRQRIQGTNNAEAPGSSEQQGSLEFGEDDMAYQLAAMGESYALDPGEYGDEGDAYYDDGEDADFNEDDGTRGIPFTSEERTASFNDLLADHAINPFTTWDAVIASNEALITDDRYTLLPTTKARKEAFTVWSTARIATIHAAKAAQEKKDPRIAFLALLAQHASPKLFWAEFRRKHRAAPAMQARQLSDRDREKLYREHIARVTKMPPDALKADLAALLASIPASAPSWCRDTPLDAALPPQLLTDVRYISLKPQARDAQVAAHLATLPAASELSREQDDDDDDDDDDEAQEPAAEAAAQRRRAQAQALQERERVVEEAKRRQSRELAQGRERLRGEEEELARAMRVGREGLQSQLQ